MYTLFRSMRGLNGEYIWLAFPAPDYCDEFSQAEAVAEAV